MSDMVDPADDALIAHLAAFSVYHAGSRVTVSADSIRRTLARLYMAEEARDTALTDKHDELAEASARIAALEDALRPFQNYANATLRWHSKHQPDSEVVHNMDGAKLTLGDLRRARALLATKP